MIYVELVATRNLHEDNAVQRWGYQGVKISLARRMPMPLWQEFPETLQGQSLTRNSSNHLLSVHAAASHTALITFGLLNRQYNI